MGSRGSFLESGGFRVPAKWHTVDYVEGIKVLAPKDSKASKSLPDRSNTPGTSYLKLNTDNVFSQLRVFGDNRLPIYDIDYGMHQGKKTLHVHYYLNGNRNGKTIVLHKEDELYKKYKSLFKGVKI